MLHMVHANKAPPQQYQQETPDTQENPIYILSWL